MTEFVPRLQKGVLCYGLFGDNFELFKILFVTRNYYNQQDGMFSDEPANEKEISLFLVWLQEQS